jgi:hypothetical protein
MIGLKFGQPSSLGESVRSAAVACASANEAARSGISPEGELIWISASGADPDSGVGVLVSLAAESDPDVGVLISPGCKRLAVGSVSGAACVAPRIPAGAWMMINMRKAASIRVLSMTLFMSYSSFVTNHGMSTEMSPNAANDGLTGRDNEIEQT